ncbi:hypothetical protein RI129_003335 [Pyrocoelia pectoralis]|uniref:Gamma-glutamylcyclotransferase family protein n=1 Tax=Pyrocoelia pectoralis TaxID=417401 RepID=A0AAN7ZUY0_9COLE
MYSVFVYGTLKKDEPNHHWLSNNKSGYSKFVCSAETIERYPLIIATKYNVPFLLYSPGNGEFVKGEIYEVDENVLKDLDELEEHPNFYIREEHFVRCVSGTEIKIKVWIYFIKQFKQELLNLPMLENYTSRCDHKYVPRYNRNPDYDHKQIILL